MDMAVQPLRRFEPQTCPALCTDVGAARLHPGRHRRADRGGLLRDVQRSPGRRHHDPGIDHPCAVRAAVRLDRVFLHVRACRASPCCCSGRRTNSASIPLRRLPRSAAGPRCCCRPTTRIPIACWRDCARSMNRSRKPDTAHMFDWFVLSDTTDPAIWIAEEKCFLQLRQELGSAASDFLSPPPRKHRAQVRQYRGMGQAVRLRL